MEFAGDSSTGRETDEVHADDSSGNPAVGNAEADLAEVSSEDALHNDDIEGEIEAGNEAEHAAILEDHEYIKRNVSRPAILTLTRQLIAVVIMRTAYSRVQLRVQYPEGYPSEPPIVELSSPTLPMPLLRSKERECIDLAKAIVSEGENRPQLRVIYEHVEKFMLTNMFIPCWKEMKQVATLCEGKGKLGADEKTGILQLRLKQGEYRQAINIKVPPMYPEEGVEIEFVSSNFPEDVQYMFKSQCEEIIRRCVAGYSPDAAMQGADPLALPAKKCSEVTVRLTTGALKSLKHDVNVLKQISDLREVDKSKDKRSHANLHSTSERREARKDLRRLAKAESALDQEYFKQLKEQEQQEMRELMSSKVSDTAQPSLLAAARFLTEEYATRLPKEPCQACRESAFPADPESKAVKISGSKLRPMRTYCGHWFHFKCLDEWLTTPPFVRNCGVCERRIWHPDWPADYKILERAWQNQQARMREVNDVADFLL